MQGLDWETRYSVEHSKYDCNIGAILRSWTKVDLGSSGIRTGGTLLATWSGQQVQGQVSFRRRNQRVLSPGTRILWSGSPAPAPALPGGGNWPYHHGHNMSGMHGSNRIITVVHYRRLTITGYRGKDYCLITTGSWVNVKFAFLKITKKKKNYKRLRSAEVKNNCDIMIMH